MKNKQNWILQLKNFGLNPKEWKLKKHLEETGEIHFQHKTAPWMGLKALTKKKEFLSLELMAQF